MASGPIQPLQQALSNRTLPALDGFRMIAVMSVVLAHGGVSTFFTARHGVAGFFVLSGFLITWLLLKEHHQTGSISFRKFYARRSLRIFPAYYLFVAVTISWELYRSNSEIRSSIAPSLFYLINYYNAIEGHPNTSLAHLWSLAVEEQFYLLYPLIFMFAMRRGVSTLGGTMTALIFAAMIWRTFAYSWLGWGSAYAYNAFETRIDNLAIGCLLAVLIQRVAWQRFFAAVSSQAWMPLVTLGLLHLSRQLPWSHYEFGPAFTLDAVLLAVLLVQLMSLSQQGFWRWLNFAPVCYVGLISYPIYLWHGWALQAGDKLHFLPSTLQLLAGVIFCLMAGALSYEGFEKRFLRLKARYAVTSPQRHAEVI
ncbi:MAG: acyltransferase [Halomonadaceae bacterium]|nr:MAG: acyltransferase [Halomonadaceae bacterium]